MEERHVKMIERIYYEVVGDEFTEGVIPKVNRHDKLISEHSNTLSDYKSIKKKVNSLDIFVRAGLSVATVLGFIVAFWEKITSIFN